METEGPEAMMIIVTEYRPACYLLSSRSLTLRLDEAEEENNHLMQGRSLINSKPYQESAQHFSCLATVYKCHRKTPKSHKVCQITQQSEKYNITNCCLLVLADNLITKTDKDDFLCLAAICQFSHRKFA